MKKNRIIFVLIVAGAYALSSSLPSTFRDDIIFATMALLYVAFLIYRRLYLKVTLTKGDAILGIPVVYGLLVSFLRGYNYIEVSSLAVWAIFAVLAIIAIGSFDGEGDSNPRLP